jgi:hypothetical protein
VQLKQADARVREAEQLPDGEARQNALKNAAHLRSYADMKRLLAPVPKPKKTTDYAACLQDRGRVGSSIAN